MKNYLNIMLIVGFVSFMLACSSTPNWEGMSEREISGWKAINYDADKAREWSSYGFLPDQAVAWSGSGFDIETAKMWKDKHFSVEEAKSWMSSGFDIEQASDHRGKGLTPVTQTIDENSSTPAPASSGKNKTQSSKKQKN